MKYLLIVLSLAILGCSSSGAEKEVVCPIVEEVPKPAPLQCPKVPVNKSVLDIWEKCARKTASAYIKNKVNIEGDKWIFCKGYIEG